MLLLVVFVHLLFHSNTVLHKQHQNETAIVTLFGK
jgi:hypothetical protein